MMTANKTGNEEAATWTAAQTCEEPEERLMLAILEEALVTFRRGLLSGVPMDRRDVVDVEVWVRRHDFDWPFSFENICATLGIDADYVRAGLTQMKRQVLASRTNTKSAKVRRSRIYDRRGWKGQIG